MINAVTVCISNSDFAAFYSRPHAPGRVTPWHTLGKATRFTSSCAWARLIYFVSSESKCYITVLTTHFDGASLDILAARSLSTQPHRSQTVVGSKFARKLRHTVKNTFERLQDERRVAGVYAEVKDHVRQASAPCAGDGYCCHVLVGYAQRNFANGQAIMEGCFSTSCLRPITFVGINPAG